jgi:hypothetical protein
MRKVVLPWCLGGIYRVSVAYRYRAVSVKFIGTHAEYDAIDADTVELEHRYGHSPDSHRR